MPSAKKTSVIKRNAADTALTGFAPMTSRSFERSLPMLLMRARDAVMQRFRPHLREHDVTEQQWRILRVLAEQHGIDMQSLAERSYIQAASLSRTIPLLEGRGLVERSPDPADQRRSRVSLSKAGRTLFDAMVQESAEIYAQLETEIGGPQLREIYRMLDGLIALDPGATAASDD
ncbi:homoprotocatechuate degradation operon regulator HpaR [Pararobbsia silviterrae]|uniref:Homoprotocatechuate degradation operon regulator HpaR n=1 Tax=Pararobbsia silviterrae TaxID=1792498 RepID=A0A494Y4V2_9BURK|nr:homoprotocatechuate degradation operon regulator HpaR [Pararobbsia silviterrae]RKP57671.1 homoprotocatechuate degradation operon regulator HpaR [Pararobbsia silviterrae]